MHAEKARFPIMVRQFRSRNVASWLLGILGVCAVGWYFRPSQFLETLASIGVSGSLLWLAMMVLARLLLVETTVEPLRVLGFRLSRSDAFWIGWIRSFSNQILPLSGVALYARQIRRQAGISWSELSALSTPQFFLSALALGLIGIVATLLNLDTLGTAAFAMLCAYVALSGCAILAASRTAWLIELLPRSLEKRAHAAAAAFRKLALHRKITVKLIFCHSGAMLVRGCRLWLLFALVDAAFGWQQAILLIAIVESATLLQITPGALGVHEGAVVGAAALLQIPPDVGAAVALADRLLILATTTAFAAPALVMTAGYRSSNV